MSDIKTTKEILIQAKEAVKFLMELDSDAKNRALLAMAQALEENTEEILAANSEDIAAAEGSISTVMVDRLRLTDGRIKGMADGIRALTKLPDPVGRVLESRVLDNGLELIKVTVPMGVIAIIYESRPNVTSDAAALCLKSGSVCVLRGGKESYRSSAAVVKAMQKGLEAEGFAPELINMVEDTSRDSARELMTAAGYVDLLIPRGGAGLIRACVEQATVPCIETGTGICSIYVDGSADVDKALDIIDNAKTQRPSVCNAAEICLVDKTVAKDFLPLLKQRLVDDRLKADKQPVELRLCSEAARYIEGTPAGEKDFDTEFLDYIMAIKVVDGVKEATEHIRLHTTHHSEAVLAENDEVIDYFLAHVDSSSLYVNASTRFTDGGCFGLGCEMGISTQKLHARGPMGLNELTSYKYIIRGNGQIRE